MRIAVAGAGFQGACIALELSNRGHQVDLFDQESIPVSRAGFGNEGKIHLGLVYAKDTTHRSLEVMIRGAFHFAPCLDRWIDLPFDTAVSKPFYYTVHRHSQLSVAEIRIHFERVQDAFDATQRETGFRYLHRDFGKIYRDVTGTAEAEVFDREQIAGVFATGERAVDPEHIAGLVRSRIAEDANVEFISGARVDGVAISARGRPEVHYNLDGVDRSDNYDHVVNALWSGKLVLDRSVRSLPERPWIFRNKVGMMVRPGGQVPPIVSMTMVIGAYGDIVDYGNGWYYLSWYPDCMIGSSLDVAIADWDSGLGDDDRSLIMDRTVAALARICPGARVLAKAANRRLKGGTIFAWGDSDIHDIDSELHRRYDIGIDSDGRYHSVNTGKYTMAPMYAVELADRIFGESRATGWAKA